MSTAPLLSSRNFAHWTPKPDKRRRGGIENRENGRGGYQNHNAIEVNRRSALAGDQNDDPPGVGGIAGVLESVQAVVEFIAGRLVKMGHDEVTDGAEAGLLLRVEDKERESAADAFGGC